MFKNMKIVWRLGLGFGLILAIMIVVIVAGIESLNRTHADLEAIVLYENARTQMANEMILNAQGTALDVRAILLLGHGKQPKEKIRQAQDHLAETRKQYNANYAGLKKLCLLEKSLDVHCDDVDQFTRMEALADSSRRLQDNGVELVLAGRMADATALITGKSFPVVRRWMQTMADMIDNENRSTVLAYAEAQKRYVRMRTIMLALGAFTLALALALALAITRSITVPLKVATRLVLSRDQTMDLSGYKEGREELGDMMLVFSRNNAERKQMEEARLLSENSLREILNSLDGLVYVADMNTYETLFINKYGKDIWGDFTGKICWQNLQSGQKGPCSFCTNGRLLNPDGTPTGVYVWEFQNTITGKWYECRDSAIYWPDGRTVRMEIATDITERKKIERVVHENQERLDTIFNSIQAGIMVIDRETHTLAYVNQAAVKMIGSTREKLLDQHCQKHVCPADFGACPITDKGQKVDNSERVLLTADGRRVPILKTVVEVELDGRQVLVESFVDISERKRAELEREAMITELKEALANIKQLKGLIPICASCKKIRNDGGYWQQVEEYVADHTDADFSHGLCEECAHKLYPDYFPDKKNEESK